MTAPMYTTGIEIEAGFGGANSFNNVAGATLARRLSDQGLAWHPKRDGSAGHELVSGVITTPEQLRHEVPAVTQICTESRLGIHQTCGLHVHIGFKTVHDTDLSAKYRIFRFLSCYEEALFDLHRPWSARQDYCVRLKPSHYASVTSGEGLKSLLVEDGRYWWVNVKSMEKHGTLEFRIANGTLDPEQIIGWVAVLQCIFHAVCTVGVKLPWHERRDLRRLAEDALFDQNPHFGQTARNFIEAHLAVDRL